jgi:hypothetical protein
LTKESRRNVLKGLAVTVPAVWATPIVESVILPAHAGGSFIPCKVDGDCPDGFNGCGDETGCIPDFTGQ